MKNALVSFVSFVSFVSVVSVVALLLGALVIVTWVRSGGHVDEFSVNARRRYFVQSAQGRINLGVAQRWEYRNSDRRKYFQMVNGEVRPPDPPFVETPHADRWWFGMRRPYVVSRDQSGWFGSDRLGASVSGGGYYDFEWADVIYFPHWAAMLALAPLAALPLPGLIARWRRARRRRLQQCERCGYDLRASSGRCPECGVDAAAAVS